MYQTRTYGVAEDIEEMTNKQYDSIVRTSFNVIFGGKNDIPHALFTLAEMITDDKSRETYVRRLKRHYPDVEFDDDLDSE
jgi:hypothetical protein